MMKKLLPILLILQIFCIGSFAQEKKPTKQETMDWIADKMKLIQGSYTWERTHYEYKSGTVHFCLKYRMPWGDVLQECFDISLQNVLEISPRYYNKSESGFIVSGKDVICQNSGCHSKFYSWSNSSSKEQLARFAITDFSSEPNLEERMFKAFQTLAEYNNAEKPKETF
ncbi:MAG: hypothetical protein HS105_05560 [Chloracidobacterium sp.]|nr:hypothetical protein [Chloracidobacterium sp.]